eukprot:TRINITY_DN12986_c0_g2_i1.p1 TRINITY_DN12986_c0_g2~~TRINITY_DN12986_c0_g2_i1.p1  ORF type:complete len:1556 (-),score=205.11 TRINITY_DN12986_c0_g2_i1:228-4286(-)
MDVDSVKFKFGKAPAPANASNYDDWNEIFWSPKRLRRVLGLQCEDRQLSSAADVWPSLTTVDWSSMLKHRKSHLELHSPLPIMVGCYRIYLLQTLAMFSLLWYWVVHLVQDVDVGHQLWDDYGWVFEASLGLIAPAWMLLFQIGFQALTPCLARLSRLQCVVKLICIDMLPLLSFYLLYFQHSADAAAGTPGTFEIGYRKVSWTIRIYDALRVAHVFLSVFVLCLALSPRTNNLYRWKFYPHMSRSRWLPAALFWGLTVLLWSPFSIQVARFGSRALIRIWDVHESTILTLPIFLSVQFFLVLLPIALVFFSSLCFFMYFVIALVGFCVGAYRLGGLRLMWYRRGIGMAYVPERVCSRLLNLPTITLEMDPSSTRFFDWRHWWRRMSGPQLGAFLNTWNTFIKHLRAHDLVSDQERDRLSLRSAEAARRGEVPRLFTAMVLNAMPSNAEARRRIVTLARSLQVEPLLACKVGRIPTLSVLIPHYSEIVTYRRQELFTSSGSTDLLRFLIKYYRDEFKHFIQRLDQGVVRDLEQSLASECSSAIDHSLDDIEGMLCEWASLRMQTLYRTVEGISAAYGDALSTLLKHQQMLPEEECDTLVCDRLQVVVAMQQYANIANPRHPAYSPHQLSSVEDLFTRFGKFLSIAFIDKEDAPDGSRYYSCLIDATCPKLLVGDGCVVRQPKFRVELPGFPILGHGKSDNQNCAVIFTRGEILQMIDANQEAYFEASLFLPSALQEFCASEHLGGRRPGIVGFREHIFSAVGLLGRIAADSEFTFGTMIQRTLDWPLNARLHYGHPDLMDKLQIVQQGGVSKGTKGLNLSEDVFAGIDLLLRGGCTAYREYFHVGKGRDMGFMSTLSFYAKVSMGNAEQAITRQWMRLGLHLDFGQLLSVFYTHIGFYVNQALTNRSLKSFCFTAAFFARARNADFNFAGLAAEMVSNCFGWYYLMFMLSSMLPLAAEVLLEEGLAAALWRLCSSLLSLSPVFSTFQSKLMGYYFETTLHYGGAQYIPTGRGLATAREPFVKLFRSFAASHMYDALEVAAFLVFSMDQDYGMGFYACVLFTITSWFVSPFLFNPRQFESASEILGDGREWMAWMLSPEASEPGRDSWHAWQAQLQEMKRNSMLVWALLGNSRLVAVLCTSSLIYVVIPNWSCHSVGMCVLELLLVYAPPFLHLLVCSLLSMLPLAGCRAATCLSHVPLALLFVLISGLEIYLLPAQYIACVMFHKFVCLRWMLEAADGLVAYFLPTGKYSTIRDVCRLWAFSVRFVRDMTLGLALGTGCLLLTLIPGVNSVQTLFLFRTRRPREEGAHKPDRTESAEGSDLHLRDDPLLNFFRAFAPEYSATPQARRAPPGV